MRTVIVGYGMAGSRLAAELRARDGDAKVTVLGAEGHRAYNRILLSSVLAGKMSEVDVALAESAGHGLDIRPGTQVIAIDRGGRTVTTACGEAIEYDHLVLATGSQAVIPPLSGLDRENLPDRVAVFRTLDDCRRIIDMAGGAGSALVLGGGLLGLEAARGLAGRGLRVEVVHAVGHLMERQLDGAASRVLEGSLAKLGITAHLDAMASSVQADEQGVTLGLVDGRELRADLLVISCGVRAETQLARAAGLTVDRGVVVDDRLLTNDPRISAIGDCAQHDGLVGGLVAPAWEQAKVVARRLTGDEPQARYRVLPTVTRLKASGIDLAAMGDPAGATGTEEVCFADPARGTYAKLVIDGDRLTGAILLGDNPAVGTVIQLFDRGAPVPADRRALLLGRAIGARVAAPAQSPALMPDAATVCQCNAVSKGSIVRCWRSGARSTGEVVAATRATTGCGTCKDAVEGIVAWLSTVDSEVVS